MESSEITDEMEEMGLTTKEAPAKFTTNTWLMCFSIFSLQNTVLFPPSLASLEWPKLGLVSHFDVPL